ncbi:MAG: sulfotransferase, partial [Maioricimonas sp. JB049]
GPRRSEVTRLFGEHVYHFDDAATAIRALQTALADDADRRSRVAQAREITLAAHLYDHRAGDLLAKLREAGQESSPDDVAEDRIAWIIGCGRTGSTWLAEMLGDLPKIRRWHEPYFGRFLKHLSDRPREQDRQSSFFARRHQTVWLEGLRAMFFRMVRDRYPQFGRHSLVVKEVNTPELYGWLQTLFPTGKLILLVRDPFDVLDSYLDLQKPGSWNTQFGDPSAPLSDANVRRTAEHIRSTTSMALAAYEEFPLEQRLKVSYEELLDDPVPHLLECSQLIGIDASPDAAAAVADRHAFANYLQTGERSFRRQGKAGGWRDSANFTDDVSRIAREILGPLRGRLGYIDG